jgi:hypothetical protein
MSPRPGTASLAVLALWSLLPTSAGAQSSGPDPGYRRFVALDLDAGGARDSSGWQLFGRAGAGLSLFDGQRLWTATVDVAGFRSDRRTVGLSGQFASVATGLGATVTVLRDVTEGAFGAGAGVSFSLVHVQALVFADEPRTKKLVFFVRVPVGLLGHVL